MKRVTMTPLIFPPAVFFTVNQYKGKRGDFAYYHCWGSCPRPTRIAVDRAEEWFRTELAAASVHPDVWTLAEAMLKQMVVDEKAARAEKALVASRRASELKARRDRLVDAFLDQAIDRETYQARLTALDRELASMDFEHPPTKPEALDATHLLAWASVAVTQLPSLWDRLGTDDRSRLGALVFPSGVVASKRGLRTPTTASIFMHLRRHIGGEDELVEQKGFEPSTPTLRTWCSPS